MGRRKVGRHVYVLVVTDAGTRYRLCPIEASSGRFNERPSGRETCCLAAGDGGDSLLCLSIVGCHRGARSAACEGRLVRAPGGCRSANAGTSNDKQCERHCRRKSSSFSLAKAKAAAAFSKEKPRSSTTEWVDILTSSSYDDEVYDGIPELIESINLQASGPAEASRAVRKKIKHGNTHQQYRALVILNALVENCGPKFHTNCFADGQLTDALRHLATDSTTDPKVRKKVMAVLASWSRQFKDDRSAAGIAGLYRQVKPAQSSRKPEVDLETLTERDRDGEQRQRVKEEAKRKAREKRLRVKIEEAKRKKAASQTTSTLSRRKQEEW